MLMLAHNAAAMDCEGIWITARDFPAICKLIAHSLDLPTTFVLAEIQATRSRNPQHVRRWHRLALLAKKAQAVGLVILAVGVGVVGGNEAAEAAQGIFSNFSSTIYTSYA